MKFLRTNKIFKIYKYIILKCKETLHIIPFQAFMRPYYILAMLTWLTCFLHFMILNMSSVLNLSLLYCKG